MPRRSDADLSIVPMVPGRGRPEPPKALDPTEARAWNDVIDALPGQWVDLAGQIILRRTAAQVAIAERLEARLRDLATMSDDEEALAAEAELAVMHRATSKSRHRLPDGVAGDAQEPHGRSRRPGQVRARSCLPPMGDRRQEVRWPAVSGARSRSALSQRPT